MKERQQLAIRQVKRASWELCVGVAVVSHVAQFMQNDYVAYARICL